MFEAEGGALHLSVTVGGVAELPTKFTPLTTSCAVPAPGVCTWVGAIDPTAGGAVIRVKPPARVPTRLFCSSTTTRSYAPAAWPSGTTAASDVLVTRVTEVSWTTAPGRERKTEG